MARDSATLTNAYEGPTGLALTPLDPNFRENPYPILAALREHKIVIPFPQRDLHVQSTVQQVTPQEDEDPRPASGPTPVAT
jgi:hypothetical protein